MTLALFVIEAAAIFLICFFAYNWAEQKNLNGTATRIIQMQVEFEKNIDAVNYRHMEARVKLTRALDQSERTRNDLQDRLDRITRIFDCAALTTESSRLTEVQLQELSDALYRSQS